MELVVIRAGNIRGGDFYQGHVVRQNIVRKRRNYVAIKKHQRGLTIIPFDSDSKVIVRRPSYNSVD